MNPGENNKHICTVLEAYDESQDLGSVSFWIHTDNLGITGLPGIKVIHSSNSLTKAMAHLKGSKSPLGQHPRREELFQFAQVFDLVGVTDTQDCASTCNISVTTGGKEIWYLFVSQVEQELEARKVGTHPGPRGDETATMDCCPARMFSYIYEDKRKNVAQSLLSKALTWSQNLVAFVSLKVGGHIKPWYHDSGSSLSQMTPAEIAWCDPPPHFSIYREDSLHICRV